MLMAAVTISIIDVDLGSSVASIIQDDVTEITTENRRQIDDAIREAIAQQEADDAIKNAKLKQEDALKQRMEKLYAELLAASSQSTSSFLSSQTILSIAAPDMPNMISFVGKMRNWLKANDKPYKLASKKKGKEQGYRIDELTTDTSLPEPTEQADPAEPSDA